MIEKQQINSVEDMLDLGKMLARRFQAGDIVFLEGELGAGKTTLTRGILSGFGYFGAVKSPTFTLVESYLNLPIKMHHFDLYRLSDPEELELIGWRDYFDADSINLIEWPTRAGGLFNQPNYRIQIRHQDVATRIVFIEKVR